MSLQHAGRYYEVGTKRPFLGASILGKGLQGAGEVFIRSTVTHRKVWREGTGFVPGENAGSLVELIEEDLENLGVAEFEQKWNFPSSGAVPD